MAVPTIVNFFQRYSSTCTLKYKEHALGLYMIEMTLLEASFARYRSSTIAASTVYLIRKVFYYTKEWPPELVSDTCLSIEGVQPCAKELFIFLIRMQNSTLTATKRKYAHRDRFEVSKYAFETSRKAST